MSAHLIVSIAQIVVYIPATVFAHYVGIRCWRYGPKLAWYLLIMFTLVRLVGGVLEILYEQDKRNVPLIKATYILLNVGLVPLLSAFNRLSTLISSTNFPDNELLRKVQKICGILVLVAAGLLGAAGGMTGKPEEAHEQSKLSKVAYFEFLAIMIVLSLLCAGMYIGARSKIRKNHQTYLGWLLVAVVPLSVRTAYGVIGVLDATGPKGVLGSKWSPLFGSATAFALMGLLPEYIVLGIYMYVAHLRLRDCRRPDWVDDRPPKQTLKEKVKSQLVKLQNFENGGHDSTSQHSHSRDRAAGGIRLGVMGRGEFGGNRGFGQGRGGS